MNAVTSLNSSKEQVVAVQAASYTEKRSSNGRKPSDQAGARKNTRFPANTNKGMAKPMSAQQNALASFKQSDRKEIK
jgi:hypothetical protein